MSERPDPASSPGNSSPSATVNHRRDFALAPALRARLLATGTAALGVVVLLGSLLVLLTPVPTAVLTGLMVLVVLGLLGLGWAVALRHWVVRIDDRGYRVRFVRGVGITAAPWADVYDVQTSWIAGSRCLVLRLRSGATTTLPVDVLAGDAETLTDVVLTHLDRQHGRGRRR